MLPAVLRGFSEEIQYEVKFPLKSNGWEGKLCYLQQQQCCCLLVSNEPAEGFILLISLRGPRQHILLACSFPRGELQQGGCGVPWQPLGAASCSCPAASHLGGLWDISGSPSVPLAPHL